MTCQGDLGTDRVVRLAGNSKMQIAIGVNRGIRRIVVGDCSIAVAGNMTDTPLISAKAKFLIDHNRSSAGANRGNGSHKTAYWGQRLQSKSGLVSGVDKDRTILGA